MNRNIFIIAGGTGGHFFPAEVLYEDLLSKSYQVKFITDNRCKNYIKDHSNTYIVKVHRLSGSLRTRILGFLLLPFSILHSIFLFLKFNPKIVISFGGYVSFPHLISAFLLRKKIILHEQNKVCGKVNLLFARLANNIAISYPVTYGLKKYQNKLLYTGNFVRSSIKKIASIKNNKEFVILILGGSLGSSFFSEHLTRIIIRLSKKINNLKVIQQVRVEEIERVRSLYIKASVNFELSSFFSNINLEYSKADLLIARSGASTISEIIAVGLVSILIPLKNSSDNHQYYNAKDLYDKNGCILLEEKKIESLDEILYKLINNKDQFNYLKESVGKLQINNTSKLIDLIDRIINS